ncbi:hypothetical protein M011DRAFT_486131 [Sporormia fimetaria CBS 119925]|uniref:Transcription factor TFIIIB component B'' Myb domain-containing protein n=1 Tax=Sporormia fimetaria CBS 119925 TaxID=1340428 RepID=A0A6A6VC48_9PLEO|nr:hypothetical protein M011DRAFT_486131 [Sporormia fimetaria CBS 119925]
MSTEQDAPVPNPTPGGSSQAAKPTAAGFVSTFINKDTSGKKFVPKAGRRRPAARQPTKAIPSETNAPTAPTADPAQTALPTPDATQADATGASQPPSSDLPVAATAEDSHASPPPSAPSNSDPAPSTTQVHPNRAVVNGPDAVPESAGAAIPAETVEPPNRSLTQGTTSDQDGGEERGQGGSQQRGHSITPTEMPPVSADLGRTAVPEAIEPVRAEETVDASAPIIESDGAALPAVSWQPVNIQTLEDVTAQAATRALTGTEPAGTGQTVTDDSVEAPQAEGTKKPRKQRKDAKKKRKAAATGADTQGEVAGTTPADGDVATNGASADFTPEEPPRKPRKPRKDAGKTRKKQTVQTQEADEVAEAQVGSENQVVEGDRAAAADNVARPRAKRASKRKRATATDAEGAEQRDSQDDITQAEPATKRKRAAKKRQTTATPGAGEDNADGESAARPARPRGRQRETTPSDAEELEVDPETEVMGSLASLHFRKGRISEREKKMRTIDWDDVKRKRREAEALGVPVLEDRAEVDAQLERAREAAAEHQPASVRMDIVDGRFVVVQEQQEVVIEGDDNFASTAIEEGDITERITTRSFMREGKRYPQEFMLPGQGTRWTPELTERFYDSLQIFGTDFGMIATLFPGCTRRSIKLKFNKEERVNPVGIKEALSGQRNTDWDAYLAKSGMKETQFRDPRAIEAELEAYAAKKQVEIDAAKKKTEEQRRQRRLAGAELTDDEAENGGGAAGGRKKKTTKKAVAFVEEEGVEVLGDADGGDWSD